MIHFFNNKSTNRKMSAVGPRKIFQSLGVLSLISIGTIIFRPVHAQIEEVLVTAQKREQSVQDIGLTVTSFNDQDLRELQTSGLFATGDQIPNVQVYTSANLPSYTIRGIGLNEFQASFDSPVAIHIDEVYMSKPFMVSFPFFDMQRVEALKGPQGTLFGRNTTGGAVNYYTQPPSDTFEAGITVTADEYERYRFEGYVNDALTENVSGRLSFYSAVGSGGPYFNQFTNDDIGRPDQQVIRGQLAWNVSDKTNVRLLVHGGTDKSELTPYKGPGIFNIGGGPFGNTAGLTQGGFCPQLFTGKVITNRTVCSKYGGLSPDPNAEFDVQDEFTVNQDDYPTADNTAYGGYIHIEHDLEWATLTSITAFEQFDRDQREDADNSPFDGADAFWYNEITQVSQELRLAGELSEGRWRYLVGLFYENDDFMEIDSVDTSDSPFGIFPPFAPRLAAEFEVDVESIALFTHNEFDINENLTLNIGLRTTRDETTLEDAVSFLGADDPTGDKDRLTQVIVADTKANVERVDKDTSYRVGLEWTPMDDILIYGNISTGFRSGGFAVPFGGVITSYDPETIFAQEFGMKTQLFNKTLQVNAAVFKYEYDDLQVNVDEPPSPIPLTQNIGDSEIYGFEADMWWAPNEQWDIKAGVGYLDSEIIKSSRTITTYSGPIPLEGKTPINSPEWTFNGLIRHERPLTDNINLILMTDFRWTDERFLEVTNTPFDQADDYWLLNVRAALASADGKWELAVWGKNVTDTAYLTYINNISFFKLDIYNEPSTWGATLNYKFE